MMENDLRLSLSEVCNYLQSTPASRNFVEGEVVLNAGHIILCGKTDAEDDWINIFALSLQTSALKNNPHEIKGQIEMLPNNICKIKQMTCTCKAGLGGQCKHVSAVLLHCTRLNRFFFIYGILTSPSIFNDINNCVIFRVLVLLCVVLCFRISFTKLEKVSPTDGSCARNKNKRLHLEEYSPRPLNSFSCFETVVPTALPKQLQEDCRANLLSAAPNSALAIHKKRCSRDLPTSQITTTCTIDANLEAALSLVCSSSSLVNITCTDVLIRPVRECCQNIYDSLHNFDYKTKPFYLKNCGSKKDSSESPVQGVMGSTPITRLTGKIRA